MRRVFSLACCALIAACATPEPAPVSPASSTIGAGAAPAATTQTYAEDLLAYLGRLRTMNDSALGAEAVRMRRDTSEVARVKAALAMTLASQSDEAEILELVEPITRRAGGDRDVRAMAAFIQATTTERRRLKQRAAAAAGELREERRAAETQKQRAEQLQQKLDALTELEKSLASREAQVR